MSCLFYLFAWPFILAYKLLTVPFVIMYQCFVGLCVLFLKIVGWMILLPFYILKWIWDAIISSTLKDRSNKSIHIPRIDVKSVSDYDYMDGHQFEYAIANLLRKRGYSQVNVTKDSGDDGLDIIAYKNGLKIGFQCKCFSHPVGNKAVQEAYTGMAMYSCDHAVVVTNNFYTNAAINTATQTGVELWDRDTLNRMWREHNKTDGFSQSNDSVNNKISIAADTSEKIIMLKTAIVAGVIFIVIFLGAVIYTNFVH